LLDLAETRALLGSTRSALAHIDSVRGTADEAYLARDIERLEEDEQRLLRKIHKCRRWRNRVRRAIYRVEPIGLRKVLKLRYILGMTWEGIAGSMHCDISTVHRWHRMALELIKSKKQSETGREAPNT